MKNESIEHDLVYFKFFRKRNRYGKFEIINYLKLNMFDILL